uniref:Uncharacterized protein n=1 Tax=Panagrellus redivivus TaxID=6233 RepID=A0A7E4VG44_PANRE
MLAFLPPADAEFLSYSPQQCVPLLSRNTAFPFFLYTFFVNFFLFIAAPSTRSPSSSSEGPCTVLSTKPVDGTL